MFVCSCTVVSILVAILVVMTMSTKVAIFVTLAFGRVSHSVTVVDKIDASLTLLVKLLLLVVDTKKFCIQILNLTLNPEAYRSAPKSQKKRERSHALKPYSPKALKP